MTRQNPVQYLLIVTCLLLLFPLQNPGYAAEADVDVVKVRAVHASATGLWTFHVTLQHNDTGWNNYANGWDVVLSDGSVVKRNPGDKFTRLLLHPHEHEQPFTRSQSGLLIPADQTKVVVRGHDLVDGFGGREITLDLTQDAGDGFTVERN